MRSVLKLLYNQRNNYGGNLFNPGIGMNIPGNFQATAREAKPLVDV
ncbi:MAG: hypothetical protein IJT58_02515 [Synergistaceae bacterium]|nr:hypothetical protein [Synergistaceae bacterium]